MDTNLPYSGVEASRVNAIAVSLLALLSIFVAYLPLRSFWSHSNVPAISIVIAIGIYNFFTFVNAIIWYHEDVESLWRGDGLCDIQALLRFPITTALACSLCCLTRNLANCLNTDNARVEETASMKLRKKIMDALLCWTCPVLQMALHYVVQVGRYEIYPVFGCADVLDNSWPTIVIVMAPCPVFMLFNVFYAILFLIRLHVHRRSISSALTTSGSGMPARKYIKLVLITFCLIVIYVPVQSVFFFLALPVLLQPYSWSRIHDLATWNVIRLVHTGDYPFVQYDGWSGIAMAFLLWAFFGFTDAAVDKYRAWMVKLGFAYFWPSLKLTREERRRPRSTSTRGSLTSRFDLVGWVSRYCDGDLRKGSGSTTMIDNQSDITASRKSSHGTLTGLNRVTTGSTDQGYLLRNVSLPDSSVLSSSMSDIISPALPAFVHSGIFEPSYRMEHRQIVEPAMAPTPCRGNFFSTFCTQLNAPLPIVGYRTATPSQIHSGSHIQLNDLEAQHPAVSGSTLQTNIWSGSGQLNPSTLAHAKPMSVPIIEEDENDDIDPLAPKKVSRRYWERERREMQRRKAEEGVIVQKSFVVMEETASTS